MVSLFTNVLRDLAIEVVSRWLETDDTLQESTNLISIESTYFAMHMYGCHIPHLPWPILPTDFRYSCGFTSIGNNCKYGHGGG